MVVIATNPANAARRTVGARVVDHAARLALEVAQISLELVADI